MKKNVLTTTADFSITYVTSEEWDPQDIYNDFVSNKSDYISSLSHELKHKYDSNVKDISLYGDTAKYVGTQKSRGFDVKAIDTVFLIYLYYTSSFEELVRMTEMASLIKSNNITKKDFKNFLINSKLYERFKKIKSYTYEELRSSIKSELSSVVTFLEGLDEDVESLSEDQIIDRFLEIVYINLVNNIISDFDRFMEVNPLNQLFSFFGLSDDEDDDNYEIIEVKRKFFKFMKRYQYRPLDYFKDEIKVMNKSADKTLRKLSKLYDLAKD